MTADSTRLSRRQEYAEATRSALLQAAERLFIAREPGRVSVDDIAAAARVSKGTVYHHFEDKAAVFEAVYRRQLVWLAADIAAVQARHTDPWRQLWAVVEAYVARQGGSHPAIALLSAAAATLGPARWRSLEEEVVLPRLLQPLERLAAARELVVGDVRLLGRLALGTLREAAATPDPESPMAPKAVQAMLRGLQRAQPPRC